VIPLSRLFAAAAGAQRVAFGHEGARSTEELRADVASLASLLAPLAGGRVALHCQDAYAFAVGLLALGQVGAVAVLVPSRQPGALLRLAGELAGFLLDGTDTPRQIAGRPCTSPLAAPRARRELVALEREAPWAELFTSGTTGDEKPVVKAVRHLEDEVAMLEARFGAALGPGARMLSTASPQHLYGLLFRVLWPLAAGRPFLRTALLHPEELAPSMEAADFALATTPVALRRLAERGALASHAARCRAVFSSGGPLDADVARRVNEALGAPPFEVYGSTETGGIAVRQQRAGDEPWQPLPGVETAVDPEDGRLVVSSPFVSGGERVDAVRTRLATGDRAEPAAGAGFRLRGRADRVVKIAEKRLSLPDMESRLREHPAVEEAALVMIEGPGEARVAAVVVLTPAGREAFAGGGRRALGRELSEHLARDFDRVLLPRAWRVVDALPRDAQGKVSARALRAVVSEPATRPELLAFERGPRGAVVEWRIPRDLAQLEGHFPGHPVVAGVVQVHWVMGVLEELLGAAAQLASLEALKFHELLGPDQRVRLRLETEEAPGSTRFRFQLADATRPERLFSSGRGQLSRPGRGQPSP
jgi:acyl-coenzyme A synthetase/AMP-(fatty) acid ligase